MNRNGMDLLIGFNMVVDAKDKKNSTKIQLFDLGKTKEKPIDEWLFESENLSIIKFAEI